MFVKKLVIGKEYGNLSVEEKKSEMLKSQNFGIKCILEASPEGGLIVRSTKKYKVDDNHPPLGLGTKLPKLKINPKLDQKIAKLKKEFYSKLEQKLPERPMTDHTSMIPKPKLKEKLPKIGQKQLTVEKLPKIEHKPPKIVHKQPMKGQNRDGLDAVMNKSMFSLI